MKRIVFTVIAVFATFACQAQEHLRFMDIPIEGSLEVFYNKLIKDKGLVASKMTEGEQYRDMETKKLTGTYYGIKNCTFYIRKHNRLDNISSVIVEDTLSTLSELDAKQFIARHDAKYGNHAVDSTRYSVWYTWKSEKGDVEIGLHDKGFRIYYTDYSEKKIREIISEEYEKEYERQTIKEICGIPFGSSYETTKEVLENKYGEPSFLSDKTKIFYPNKTYAGISFDDIIFLFQSDGYRSYLNGCVFILEAKSLSEAKEKRDLLYRRLRWKYDMKEGIGDDGIKYYYGGHSPVPLDGFGFSIEIIKYENRSSIPYAARLMYGRYNYVKEEF